MSRKNNYNNKNNWSNSGIGKVKGSRFNKKRLKKLNLSITAIFVLSTILGTRAMLTYFKTKEVSSLIQMQNSETMLSQLSEEGKASNRVNWIETTEEDGSKKEVPVPKGFSASRIPGENTVNGGFVIYEIKGDDDGAWTNAEKTDLDWNKILPESGTVVATQSKLRAEKNAKLSSANNTAEDGENQVNENSMAENSENQAGESNVAKNEENQINKNGTVQNSENQAGESNIVKNEENQVNENSTAENNENQAGENNTVKNEEKNEGTNSNEVNKENQVTNPNEVNKENNSNQAIENINEKDNSNGESNNIAENSPNNNINENNNSQNTDGNNNNSETNLEEQQNNKTNEESDRTNNIDSQSNKPEEGIASIAEDGNEAEVTNTEVQAYSNVSDWTQEEQNVFNLQKTHNQYVWVPISNTKDLYGTDGNGKLWGKLYSFSSSSRSKRNWNYIDEANNIINITNATNYREPDITKYRTDYDIDLGLNRYLSGQTQYELLSKEMEENFYSMIRSIEKYGGFYIGRYETGRLESSQTSQAVVRKMNTNIASVTWYNSFKGCKQLNKDNENIVTSLISGTLWDATLEWLVQSGAKNSNNNTIGYSGMTSSASWGNYYNSTFTYIDTSGQEANKGRSSSTRIPSGSSEYTKANNIYDLAGNVWEWTLEAYSTGSRVCRGGYYFNYGYDGPASSRYYVYSPTYSSNGIRFPCLLLH